MVVLFYCQGQQRSFSLKKGIFHTYEIFSGHFWNSVVFFCILIGYVLSWMCWSLLDCMILIIIKSDLACIFQLSMKERFTYLADTMENLANITTTYTSSIQVCELV